MKGRSIQLKSKQEIEIMRRANLVVHEVLYTLAEMVVPGVSTADLDAKAKELSEKKEVLSL